MAVTKNKSYIELKADAMFAQLASDIIRKQQAELDRLRKIEATARVALANLTIHATAQYSDAYGDIWVKARNNGRWAWQELFDALARE